RTGRDTSRWSSRGGRDPLEVVGALMPLPMPNLDDRRWLDLVEEGRSLIPLYGPEWTDHNYHDPGVTLIELLAWVAEMDLYELNRVPERHKRKFLALVGIAPE